MKKHLIAIRNHWYLLLVIPLILQQYACNQCSLDAHFEDGTRIVTLETMKLYGTKWEVITTYEFYDQFVKLEQEYNHPLGEKAGMWIDLQSDSLLLFGEGVDFEEKKYKTTIEDFKNNTNFRKLMYTFPNTNSTIFAFHSLFQPLQREGDTIEWEESPAVQTRYLDTLGIYDQTIIHDDYFEREIMELLFPGIPMEIGFPLEVKITLDERKIENLENRDLAASIVTNTKSFIGIDHITDEFLTDYFFFESMHPMELQQTMNYSYTSSILYVEDCITMKSNLNLDDISFSYEETNDLEDFMRALPRPEVNHKTRGPVFYRKVTIGGD
ncbi:MAG: hypothetical protein OIF50_07770 [Flavobacteriaceae bacterium]|nr:hypothetical protein [Flavobacteriaceae bacterium]